MTSKAILIALNAAAFVLLTWLLEPVLVRGTLMVGFIMVAVLGWKCGPRMGASLAIVLSAADLCIRWGLDFGEPIRPAPLLIAYVIIGMTGYASGAISIINARLARAQTINQATLDIVLVARCPDGLIIEANETAADALGYERDAMIGRLSIFDIETSVDWRDSMARAEVIAAGHNDGQFRKKNGGSFPVNMMLSLVQIKTETLLLCSARDITEQRTLESQLVAAERKRLEVETRDKLHQANRLAQLGTMAAGIAHEINNPLTFVMANHTFLGGALDDLRGTLPETDAERRSEQFEIIEESLTDAVIGGKRIQDITKELSLFSRASDDLCSNESLALIASVSLKMARHHFGHEIALVTDLDSEAQVFVNPGKMSQVLINLLTNAAYAIEGQPKRTIALRIEETGDNKVSLLVSDTGCGIEPAILDKIFEPFFTTKPIGRGTGLGLSVCQQIVHQFGGELSVESVMGSGTTFRLTLPLSIPERASSPSVRLDTPYPPPLAIHQDDPAGDTRPRLLIVDDEEALLRSVARSLEEYKVTVALNGLEALNQLQVEDFDVILCDLMMPEMTGMELFWATSELGLGTDMFLFMSGGAITENATAFTAAHKARILPKPLDMARLRAALADIVLKPSPPPKTSRCPNTNRCPMFPVFQNKNHLAIFKRNYCESLEGSHAECERYKTMMSGARPSPRLLPDGDWLPEQSLAVSKEQRSSASSPSR